MTLATLPLVPAYTQFDGGPLASQNCTITSFARLARYARGIITTGTRLRTCQSDQVGGTSIPDGNRALSRCYGFTVDWAAPNDGTPIPPRRHGDWISPTKARELLDARYMILVQGDFDQIPEPYRNGSTFRGDHAFTVDARRVATLRDGRRQEQAYVVDTQPKAGSGYDGQWMPWSLLMAYAHKLAGSGRIYAAWARPISLPDTSTEEPPMPGPTIRIVGPASGTVTVKGDNHAAIQLDDGRRVGLPAGTAKRTVARVAFVPALDSAPGDRTNGWLIGDEAAVLLASDVTFVADASSTDTTHTVTLTVDGQTKATVTV